MNAEFDAIMNAPLPDNMKELVRKWNTLSENMSAAEHPLPVLLPDLFWIAQNGAGKTTFLHQLTQYLKSRGNLLDFYGNVDMFEFLLSYCSKDQTFTELQRLMDTIKGAAGFRNEFRGVICIDINEWVGHHTEKHFISFMEYLAANSDNWLIILCAAPRGGDILHNLYAFLSMYLRLETIRLELPPDEILMEYLQTVLDEYGFSVTDDAKELLLHTLAALRKNPYFDGYKSVRLLAKDIVYHLYSHDTPREKALCAAMLEGFANNSIYVQNMLLKERHHATIGFK